MRFSSVLFVKKFDYVAFSLGISALLLLISNLFYETGFSSELLRPLFLMVVLYYFITRERAEKNLEKHGIQRVIFMSFFSFFIIMILGLNIFHFLKS
ncbi:hypothetical protein L3i20_v218380 [Paenibacillus sp. L3-i20]|nr:hypothetical protein L3i20_v218380 [Paenibacillus sp. L3-i20]